MCGWVSTNLCCAQYPILCHLLNSKYKTLAFFVDCAFLKWNVFYGTYSRAASGHFVA
uniref:Uncharacterized protein n=1 Tax=Arundo donax TaxID=35708 RepID=A0A0A8YUE2_ARUDO